MSKTKEPRPWRWDNFSGNARNRRRQRRALVRMAMQTSKCWLKFEELRRWCDQQVMLALMG